MSSLLVGHIQFQTILISYSYYQFIYKKTHEATHPPDCRGKESAGAHIHMNYLYWGGIAVLL